MDFGVPLEVLRKPGPSRKDHGLGGLALVPMAGSRNGGFPPPLEFRGSIFVAHLAIPCWPVRSTAPRRRGFQPASAGLGGEIRVEVVEHRRAASEAGFIILGRRRHAGDEL